MDDIVLTSTLRTQGYDARDVRRLRQRGDLVQLRRGAYAREQARERSVDQAHRDLIRATIPQLRDDAVVSHASAAVLHGLSVWSKAIDRVHVTRNGSGGGKRRSLVHVHASPLGGGDVTSIGGIPVTSLARTVLDLCRTLPFEQTVAAGDHALRLGLLATALEEAMTLLEGWPGTRQARRAIAFLDGRSESAGESVSRVRIHEAGLPAPVPQREIYGPDGRLVARVDFCWEEQRTVGEFDGKIKYGRLLKPGQSIEDVLFDEKRREDALRDLGWQIVRWLWADLYRQGVIRDRILRAFARAA
jgi:hypothetical protein